MFRTMIALLPALTCLLSLAGSAHAQDSAFDEGVRHFEAGEFDEAQEAFDQALWHSSLDVEEFRSLLVHRATLALARGETDAVDEDLLRLATLDPEYSFDRSTPPQVREAFERAAGRVGRPLSVRVSHQEEGGTVRIEARAVSDIAGLITEVRIFARVGDGPYENGTGSIALEAEDGAMVSYYAEAVGPGGSIVAREGNEQAPRSIPIGEPAIAGASEGGGNTALWVTLIVVGALAIAGGVVAAIFLTQDQDTSVQPMIRF